MRSDCATMEKEIEVEHNCEECKANATAHGGDGRSLP